MPDDTSKQMTILQTEFRLFCKEQREREEGHKERAEGMRDNIDKMTKIMYQLPCKLHMEKIQTLSKVTWAAVLCIIGGAIKITWFGG